MERLKWASAAWYGAGGKREASHWGPNLNRVFLIISQVILAYCFDFTSFLLSEKSFLKISALCYLLTPKGSFFCVFVFLLIFGSNWVQRSSSVSPKDDDSKYEN